VINQYIWIGITIGVFLAGIGIGYAIVQQSTPATSMMMTPQQMQQMMNNPQYMTQWHQTMMNNPQAFNNWMNTMMNNPQLMQNMMSPMMNNPQLSQQMYGMMFQNQQFMRNMMNNTQFQNQWMMNPNMMGGNMMGYGMMGTPITKQNDVITTINKIESILDQISSSYRSGDKDTAFSQATSAYLENYEYIEGAISAKDLNQMEKIELLLRVDLRNLIQKNEPADTVDVKITEIKNELEKVKSLF
jgi:hypothetical protein